MGLSAFNRARRMAAEKAAREAAEAEQQETDAGVTGEQVDHDAPTVPVAAALALINGAANAKAIERLPSIGTKGAAKIFEVRPENGFVALEQVAAMADLQSADWDAIAAWEAPE